MNPLALIGIADKLVGIARSAGLLKSPEDELKLRQQLSEEYESFMKLTTPPAEYVPRWVNGIQALTRPGITWVVMAALVAAFFIPGVSVRIAEVFKAFADAGTAGLMFLAIPGWWFFGRSIEKIIAARAGVRVNGNGNGQPIVPSNPTDSLGQKPAPYTSGGGFRKEP